MLFKSMISAFSMYSSLPMPQVEWNEENKRYALGFFPLIGAVIGGLFLLWHYFCSVFEINGFIYGAVCTAIPVLVTGGIHLDGFCDVLDAKASYAPRERALEIMSDSHIGAFAAIGLGLYFLLGTAFFSAVIEMKTAAAVSASFILSRALSGMGAITLKCAKKDGTLQSFARPADKKAVTAMLVIAMLFSMTAMIYFKGISGAAGIIAAVLTFFSYRSFAYKRFGGITGDTAGYFLEKCELMILAAIILTDKIMG